MKRSKVALILGMHRSGTSFLSSWLQSCDLNIGANLYGKDIGNLEGHFEDWDFIELHRTALNERRWYNRPVGKVNFEAEAYKLIAKNNLIYKQWSWKDPRTCLFLNEWHKLLPEAKAIIIFRHYLSVVDSLIRRKIQLEKNLSLVRKISGRFRQLFSRENIHDKYLWMWIVYNKSILNYLEKKERKEYVVIQLEQVFGQGELIIDFFNKHGIKLSYHPPENIFKNSLYNTNITDVPGLSADLVTTADEIFCKMQEISKKNVYN